MEVDIKTEYILIIGAALTPVVHILLWTLSCGISNKQGDLFDTQSVTSDYIISHLHFKIFLILMYNSSANQTLSYHCCTEQLLDLLLGKGRVALFRLELN